jgi:hypothetical protein
MTKNVLLLTVSHDNMEIVISDEKFIKKIDITAE